MTKQTFEQRWRAAEKRVDKIRDSGGLGVEGGIRRTVIALWLHGIDTGGSCEGHDDHGVGPWVFIINNKMPLQWEGQGAFQKKALKTLKATKEQITPGLGYNHDVWTAYQALLASWISKPERRLSKAFKAWRNSTFQMEMKCHEFILEFEQSRPKGKGRMFVGVDGNMLVAGDAETERDLTAGYVKGAKQKALAKRQKERRLRMAAFTEFLIKKAKTQ